MSALLALNGIDVSYGKSDAVRNVRLEVNPGAIVALVGPNGAGKSTTLKAVIGLLPYRGQITFDGADLARLSTESRIEAGLCLVPETRDLFTTMTVEDNLLLGGFVRRQGGERQLRAKRDEIYDLFPRLKERREQLAGTLSGGERQMLALGRALMCKPRLLMLDEPSLGLAPLIVREIFHIITALRSTGVSLLVVEQNARAALNISDSAYVLENGEIAFHGSSQELSGDARLAATYLGGGLEQVEQGPAA
jgi:branched-chain amino acid transport system ATP-binding protein